LYLFLGFVVTVVCTLSLIWAPNEILLTTGEVVDSNYLNSLRYSAFAAISILTTTGYTAAAYETWPALAVVALMAISLVGGMAGSTSGGMKIIRVWIAGKLMISGIEKVFEPKVVRPVKIGKSMVPPETRMMVMVFVLFTFVLIGIGAALLETFEGTEGIDFTTSLSAAASAVGNVGPGLSRVGADDTYTFLSVPSKLTLTILMMMGRVELLMVLALFTRRFWSRA
jgi:trk system potassium uptake protein TrkH